jgi:hypothetical protein
MTNSRLQTLIETIEFTQKLASYYISLMKEVDPTKTFSIEGKELNSLYWLVGHLAWAEDLLILKGTHGIASANPWLQRFQFGEAQHIDEALSFQELKLGAQEIHLAAMAHLQTLTDADLDKPNAQNFGFGQEPTNQLILMHFIRHLGTHIGHLSWLCKLHGVKSV